MHVPTTTHSMYSKRIAFQAMTVNAILDFALMWRWNVGGLAFATAAAGWYQAIVLFWLLRKEMGLIGGREITRSFIFSSVVGVASSPTSRPSRTTMMWIDLPAWAPTIFCRSANT